MPTVSLDMRMIKQALRMKFAGRHRRLAAEGKTVEALRVGMGEWSTNLRSSTMCSTDGPRRYAVMSAKRRGEIAGMVIADFKSHLRHR